MIRGTTPTHTFELPFNAADFANYTVTYSQMNKVVVKKEKDDCMENGNKIIVSLSQEDTLRFDENKAVEIQIKAKHSDGKVIASNIALTTAKKILDEVVF